MAISSSISRLTSYYLRQGFGATIRRAGVAINRALFANRMVLFYCDLATQANTVTNLPSALEVECVRSLSELGQQDLGKMTSFWSPKQARRNIQERFERGASLWLIKPAGNLAGYGWTLHGSTVEPHYFPLTRNDVHFFDFHVFPQYRGKEMNPILVNHILQNVAVEGASRAFIEAAEWNKPQLSSLRKTPFRRMGWATKSTLFKRTIVCWVEDDPVAQIQ